MSVCPSGLGGNVIYQPLIEISLHFCVQIPLINEHLFGNYFVRLSVGNATKGFATYGCFHPCFLYNNNRLYVQNVFFLINTLINRLISIFFSNQRAWSLHLAIITKKIDFSKLNNHYTTIHQNMSKLWSILNLTLFSGQRRKDILVRSLWLSVLLVTRIMKSIWRATRCNIFNSWIHQQYDLLPFLSYGVVNSHRYIQI